ncbi:MAG TPA: hypothetical protein PK826_04340 [Anaerolineae bacterium]|nr:hypothetical protein [Ardenticatenia bacterium]HQZ70549.1 hypothetical protein [Anaerolineae bacterium]HRA20896.1 hypothetical protein [Anaerolineae bacterium]
MNQPHHLGRPLDAALAGQDLEAEATALAARFAPGEAAGPLLRALAGGLLGALAALAVDRIWPEPFLALGQDADGRLLRLPYELLLPSLLADQLLGQPDRWGLGLLAFALSLMLVNFVYVYGQFRRFIPGGDLWRGLAWGLLMALLSAGTLLPRVGAWLEPAFLDRGAGLQLAAAGAVVLEFFLVLAAYGLTAGLISPADGEPP